MLDLVCFPIRSLPTTLNHVKSLPEGLFFSHRKHLMNIFICSLAFLHCPNVVTSPPSVIYTKLSMVCVNCQIHSNLIPSQTSGTSTPVHWIPLLAAWLCPRHRFIHMPLRFGTTSWGNCPVQVFVFLQDGCSFPSCVIFVCFILSCLVLVCHSLCGFLSYFCLSLF